MGRGCDSFRCCRLLWDALGPKRFKLRDVRRTPGVRARTRRTPSDAYQKRSETDLRAYFSDTVRVAYPCVPRTPREPLRTPYPAFAAYPCAAVCSTGILACFRRPRPVYTLEHNSLNLDAQFAHRDRQMYVFWRYNRALQYTSGTSLYTKPLASAIHTPCHAKSVKHGLCAPCRASALITPPHNPYLVAMLHTVTDVVHRADSAAPGILPE